VETVAGTRTDAEAVRKAAENAVAADGTTAIAPPTLWHNPDFLRFWFGETVSLAGTQITTLALPLTAVYVFGAGPEELGLLRFVQLVPYLAFGLVFGVWVDRVRRLPVMIWANTARMLLVGSVPALAWSGHLQLTPFLFIAFGIGIASVLFDVSWMSYLPALVRDPRQLVEANSKLSVTSTASDTVGPGVAGVLIGAFTAPIAMAIDALSYLASLISLVLIRRPEPRPERPAVRRRLIPELREGLRWVFGNEYLRAVAFVGTACNLLLMADSTLFLVYAVREKELSPTTLGFVFSIGAVGGLLGALLSAPLVRRFRLGRVYAVATAAIFLGLPLIPSAGGPRILVVVLFTGAFFVSYLGLSISNVVIMSLRQTVTPSALLGRMNAAMRTMMFGGGSLGGPVGGLLGAGLGLRPALWLISAAAVIPMVTAILSPVSRLPDAAAAAAEEGVD
jgi:MFS family permease